jgi:porphobilinogen synthase
LNRPRRLRRSAAIRDLFAETALNPRRLVVPLFLVPGKGVTEPVESMPGISRYSPDVAVGAVRDHADLGLRAFLLFGVPSEKDPEGRSAADPEGVVPTAIRLLREEFDEDVVLLADVCLCAYAEHGHCGVPDEAGHILNDDSLPLLADAALAYAEAGADFVAPSDMMDRRVAAIREALDRKGLGDAGILSYAAKYDSAYYGPFRDVADSAPASGDRSTYQMDPRNVREAVKEILLDEAEGADAVMVKPALAYLDVLAAARDATTLPLAAYNVSGEYSMVKAAAKAGYLDEARVVVENLTAMFRAGADVVITYHAREAVEKGWMP